MVTIWHRSTGDTLFEYQPSKLEVEEGSYMCHALEAAMNSDVDLRCADLEGAHLDYAKLDGINLSGACLSGASLCNAQLCNAYHRTSVIYLRRTHEH